MRITGESIPPSEHDSQGKAAISLSGKASQGLEGLACHFQGRSLVGKIFSRPWEGLMKLSYVIKFVADMNRAVKFYRDVLGLSLKFESPGWSEFVTGETRLALHPASEKNPAGAVELGFTVADVQKFHEAMSAKGVQFSMPPAKQDFGGLLAQFVDSEGGHCSVGSQ
jgi:lactoylglutathione lyase